VPAPGVVETFNEFEDRIARFVVIVKGRTVDEFTLERGEETLAHGVVVAVADGAHRGTDPSFAASLAEFD